MRRTGVLFAAIAMLAPATSRGDASDGCPPSGVADAPGLEMLARHFGSRAGEADYDARCDFDGNGAEFYFGSIALDVGGEGAWDAKYAASATVIRNRDGSYEMWYSGGAEDSNDGIGHATSDDGLTFVRDPENPILTMEPGTWHAERTYTPMVVPISTGKSDEMGGGWRRAARATKCLMYVSGRSEAGEYSIGLYVGKERKAAGDARLVWRD